MVETANLLGLSDSHISFELEHMPLLREVVPVYRALVHEAAEQGFGLRAASTYRSFERQLHIWNAKLSGQRPVLDDQGQALDLNLLSEKQRVFAVLRWSALPGASRHHWGTDFDIYDAAALDGKDLQLTVEETEEGGPFYPMYQWLDAFLRDTDLSLSRPYLRDKGGVAREPWHISYAPLATQFEQALSLDILARQIEKSDLCLRSAVLAHLDEIYDRFVLNKGTS